MQQRVEIRDHAGERDETVMGGDWVRQGGESEGNG